MVEICCLIMSSNKSECVDARSAHTIQMRVQFSFSNMHKNIMLHCSSFKMTSMCNADLLPFLMDHPLLQINYDSFLPEFRLSLQFEGVSFLQASRITSSGYLSRTWWWNVYWMMWHCLLLNLVCLLEACHYYDWLTYAIIVHKCFLHEESMHDYHVLIEYKMNCHPSHEGNVGEAASKMCNQLFIIHT